MADVCRDMPSDGDAPDKCREARRRRIETRRFTVAPAPPHVITAEKRRGSSEGVDRSKRQRMVEYHPSLSPSRDPPPPPSSTSGSSSSSSLSGGNGGAGDAPQPQTSPAVHEPSYSDGPPRFGSVSLSGRSRDMEDAVTILPCFYQAGAPAPSLLHFFGVFDGHGGSHVSALCKDRMHTYLAEELAAVTACGRGTVASISSDGWREAMSQCFRRVDEVALTSCACGRIGIDLPCRCDRAGMSSDIVGSTAVVAVLSRDHIVVANCGDSRAVLSRAGRAVPLSEDHKPDRPDELRRIEAAGGRVINLNGGARVLGILAMSRAIGDKYLKPTVISEPEITITDRTVEDECLIIASDGLWDVLSNDLACDIARRCLFESPWIGEGPAVLSREVGETVTGVQESDARCMVAATLLTRLALGRMCPDNISVIVVDLRRVSRVASG